MNAPVRDARLAAPEKTPALPALRRVQTPRSSRLAGRFVLFLFVVVPFLLLLVPWQQTVVARGEVTAWLPTERAQPVTSRINGVVKKWHVVETDRVKAGDLLVEIEDNDPDFGRRMENQKQQMLSRLVASRGAVAEQSGVVQAQTLARDANVRAAKALLVAAQQAIKTNQASKRAAEAELEFESKRYEIAKNLFEKGGLEAEITVLQARASVRTREEAVTRLTEEIRRAEASAEQATAAIRTAEANGASAIAAANATLNTAESTLLAAEGELERIQTTIERFNARLVRAPVDGIVFRIEADAAQENQAVKDGQVLATVVPDTTTPIVELFVDGVDAPIVPPAQEGEPWPLVRLQFEGYPVIQFEAFPRMSVGTFGGRAFRMDPTNEEGRFRVLVKAEEQFENDAWPSADYLRQGTQVVGYVQIKMVPLYQELWRRMNGFPIKSPPTKGDKPAKPGKPPKVKV